MSLELVEPNSAQHTVRLENFEGPLELLVHLIKKQDIDILAVSLRQIVDDYLKFIAAATQVDLDEAGEFLVLATILMQYKIRALLPNSRAEVEEQHDIEVDPGLLDARRRDHERFREIVDILRKQEEEWLAVHTRGGDKPKVETIWEMEEVNVIVLYETFRKIMDDLGTLAAKVITAEVFTVEEKMVELRQLVREVPSFSLLEYLKHQSNRLELIVTFLAILELTRLQVLKVRQSEDKEIWIAKNEAEAIHEGHEGHEEKH